MDYRHGYTIADMNGDLHFGDVVSDIHRIIERCDVPIGNAQGDAGSQQTNMDGYFLFNGIRPDSNETFAYPPSDSYASGYDFCNTKRLPYDPIVCASLLAIRQHLGDGVDISSDGRPATDEGWRQGIAIYNHCFPDRTPYTEDSVTALLDARNEFLHSAA